MEPIVRDGVHIHCEVRGSGQTILATHGYSSSAHVWQGVEVPGRRLVAWDIRGHGKSDYPADPAAYSVPASVADMVAVLDTVGADRAVLMGHSLGGFLSLEFQLAHPDRVDGLILVGTGPGYRNDEARAGWNQLADRFANSFERRGLDALSSSSEVKADVHRSADGLIHAARGILRQHDARVLEHLPLITVPTLVVVGERDEPFIAGSQYMAKKIPGARLEVIPGADHSPMTSAPAAFNDVVRAFLR